MSRKCTQCGKVKPDTEFHFVNKGKGIRQVRCKSCVNKHHAEYHEKNAKKIKEYHKEHYKRNKEYFKTYNEENKKHKKEYMAQHYKEHHERGTRFRSEYLLTHYCIDCGESNPSVLVFDHVRGEKLMGVSQMIGHSYPIELIKEEISKCSVRCNSCHTKRHAVERARKC